MVGLVSGGDDVAASPVAFQKVLNFFAGAGGIYGPAAWRLIIDLENFDLSPILEGPFEQMQFGGVHDYGRHEWMSLRALWDHHCVI